MTHILFLMFLSQMPSAMPTFLDESIAAANEKITKDPKRPEGYNDLAVALARKERETGDQKYLRQAEQAIEKSLTLEPGNFEGRRARAAVRLRQKRYEDALEEATALNRKTPDDNPMYGLIADAQIALGNYAEAEKATQRMLDLRLVNGPGMEHGAMVREIIGFPDGAIDWWNQALQLSSERDIEERAFIHTQLARIYRGQGKYDAAAQHTRQSLSLCPNYPAALVELAAIHLDRKQPKEAADLLRARLKIGQDLESMWMLGKALESAGDLVEARAAYGDFEKQARAAASQPSNANAILVRYLADHGKAGDGVAIAAQSLKRRSDIATIRAYAWALSQNGQPAEATEQIQRAMAAGTRDSGLYFDAGLIARRANNAPAAEKYLRSAFEMNANAPNSAEILKQLQVSQPIGSN
jgi:tetratricopeptide (TPR) repeat protein